MSASDSQQNGPFSLAGVVGAPGPAALELFYDLIFVAAVVVLSGSYSHHPTAANLFWLILVFVVIWLIWMQTTLLFNLDRQQNNLTRVLVLGQMLLIVLLSVAAADDIERHSLLVGPLLGLTMLLLAAMLGLSARATPKMGPYSTSRVACCVGSAVLLACSPIFGDNAFVIFWPLACAVVLVPSLRRDPLGGQTITTHHLVERFGAFTVIMLGETFVKTAMTATEYNMEGLSVISMLANFVIVFAIWWLYFSNAPSVGPTSGRGGHITWMLTHLPLHISIVGVAVGASLATNTFGEKMPISATLYLCIPLLGVLLSLVVLELLSGQPHSTRVAGVFLLACAAIPVAILVTARVSANELRAVSVVLAAVMVATIFGSNILRGQVRADASA
ncbi:MAG: low temperature requirement protein A [Microthrixaceae bacterium]